MYLDILWILLGVPAVLADLLAPGTPILPAQKRKSLLHASPDSVGLLFTTLDRGFVHVWLPLGQRLNIDDKPIIPKDPLNARITSMIMTKPELAAPEALALIECTLFPHFNQTTPFVTQHSKQQIRSVSFRKHDGLVRLDASANRFWLGGAKLESVECR